MKDVFWKAIYDLVIRAFSGSQLGKISTEHKNISFVFETKVGFYRIFRHNHCRRQHRRIDSDDYFLRLSARFCCHCNTTIIDWFFHIISVLLLIIPTEKFLVLMIFYRAQTFAEDTAGTRSLYCCNYQTAIPPPRWCISSDIQVSAAM